MTRYSPVGMDRNGDLLGPPATKLAQRKRGQRETPRMMSPVKYERPGKKTRS